jgi:hypothetical protein
MGRTKLKGMSPLKFLGWKSETDKQTSLPHPLIHLMFMLEIDSLVGSCQR